MITVRVLRCGQQLCLLAKSQRAAGNTGKRTQQEHKQDKGNRRWDLAARTGEPFKQQQGSREKKCRWGCWHGFNRWQNCIWKEGGQMSVRDDRGERAIACLFIVNPHLFWLQDIWLRLGIREHKNWWRSALQHLTHICENPPNFVEKYVVFISICICDQLIYCLCDPKTVTEKCARVSALPRAKRGAHFSHARAHICTLCWIINSKIANQTLFP